MSRKYSIPQKKVGGDEKIRRDSLLPLQIRNYEAYFNWIQVIPLNSDEIQNELIVLKEKFQDEAREIHSLLKSCGMKIISRKGTEAYFRIETRDFLQAKYNIKEAKGFIKTCLKNCVLSQEYADGLKYVFDGLEAYLQVKTGKPSVLDLDALIEFSKVPPKGKVAIWIIKDFFLEDCKRANVDRYDYMEKIIEMEPYSMKWHFHLYKALRNVRKLKPRPTPYGHERIIPDDLLSLSYICYCLAEILMTQMKEDSNSQTTRFETHIFNSPKEIASTIHEKTMKVLAMDCKVAQVYLNLSEIHIHKMPERFKNNEIILGCLKRVLELKPESPIGSHRMGLYHFKMRDHKQAAVNLRKAIKDDRTINLGAVYGLLQILMSAPIKNSVEINSIFKLFMGNPTLTHVWDKRCLRTLHYLYGCFQFMQENKEEEAITNWIIAFSDGNGSSKWSYYFLNLPYCSHRYGWPTKKLNLTNVSNTLKHVAYIEQTQFKQVLLNICNEVDDAIRTSSNAPYGVTLTTL